MTMKKVLANNQQVAHYFANKVQSEGSCSNFFFRNDRLYSYGSHFCIARHLPGGKVAFTTRTHSVSTAKHLSYARQALRGQDLVYCNDPDATAYANREAAHAAILGKLDEASTIRKIRTETREGHRIAALNIAENFNLYLEALPAEERGNVQPFDVDQFATMREARDAQRKAEEAARAAEQARRAESQREALAQWLAGGPNHGGMHALPVALRLHKRQEQIATGVQAFIQTSHGAEVPLSQALALWPVIQRVHGGIMSPGEALALVRRVGVYNVTCFYDDGSMRIGCHEISYAAFADMAARLVVAGLLNPAEQFA
jgi:hypothetical protein